MLPVGGSHGEVIAAGSVSDLTRSFGWLLLESGVGLLFQKITVD